MIKRYTNLHLFFTLLHKFTCWKLHICNIGQRKSWFCCSVSPLIVPDVDVAWYLAEDGFSSRTSWEGNLRFHV